MTEQDLERFIDQIWECSATKRRQLLARILYELIVNSEGADAKLYGDMHKHIMLEWEKNLPK